jgi:NTP pyrophosphatase (non-canonical NTP hydrolase)
MDFDKYQKLSKKTASYPLLGPPGGPLVGWIYPALGLAGEAGEVEEKIKKLVRDANFQLTSEVRRGIQDELGDLLWYMAQLASELGISLDEIATSNLAKLGSRLSRGVVRGEGDLR